MNDGSRVPALVGVLAKAGTRTDAIFSCGAFTVLLTSNDERSLFRAWPLLTRSSASFFNSGSSHWFMFRKNPLHPLPGLFFEYRTLLYHIQPWLRQMLQRKWRVIIMVTVFRNASSYRNTEHTFTINMQLQLEKITDLRINCRVCSSVKSAVK